MSIWAIRQDPRGGVVISLKDIMGGTVPPNIQQKLRKAKRQGKIPMGASLWFTRAVEIVNPSSHTAYPPNLSIFRTHKNTNIF